uniref:CENP-V/GFA domain-containing protein n=1 Tax=Lotharella globosa TaxID=91324 RepID=A0A6U3EMQ1_9EUKA|mmetsp:Transcript_7327/g.14063  ORF Transcript_7327/g.14063 Transcript_7327/m.14063 type:complete len:178 (-) Transcript_7327:145-678(-)
MVRTYRGTCACGAVSMEAIGEPLDVLSCYCSTCRRMLGGASRHDTMLFWSPALKVTGEIDYEQTSSCCGLVAMQRGKCRACKDLVHEYGQRLATGSACTQAKFFGLKPTVNIYYESRGNADDLPVPGIPVYHSDAASFGRMVLSLAMGLYRLPWVLIMATCRSRHQRNSDDIKKKAE